MANHYPKVWFITGSSTGFGRALTEAVLKRGDRVVATARKPEQLNTLAAQYPDTIKTARLDVTNPQEIHAAVNATITVFGRIDVLVNNAGYGCMGALEEVSDAAIRQQFETNVFGALNVMRAVLPTMWQQRNGHILNLSWLAGFVSFAGVGVYNGSKYALEGLSEALAKEAAPLGIKVTLVEPGAFLTDFNGRSLIVPEQQIEDYISTSGQMLSWLQRNDGKQPGDPDKAVATMIEVVESNNPPLRLVLGADAFEAIEAKLKSVMAELAEWKQVFLDTAFEGVTVGAIGQ